MVLCLLPAGQIPATVEGGEVAVMRTPRSRENGVALITILLVVVIATVLGVAMVRDQNMTILQARNFFSQSQAKQYALGGEELARQILWEDFQGELKKDHLLEAWADPEMQFDFEEGEVRIQIDDMQARLNVNSLASTSSTGVQARDRFINLFAEVGIDPVHVDRIADWIDADTNVRPMGAEDFEYLGMDRPYRTGGQMMVDITELRLLLDMDREKYLQLLPYVTALPDPETELNINTAEGTVLQTVSNELPLEIALQLAAIRDESEGFNTVTEFLQLPEVAGMGISEQGLGVQSAFFKVRATATFQGRFSYLTSIVQRDLIDGSTRVIYRNYSKKILPIVKTGEDEDEVEDNSDG
jgi:general secretion pathway protein K